MYYIYQILGYNYQTLPFPLALSTGAWGLWRLSAQQTSCSSTPIAETMNQRGSGRKPLDKQNILHTILTIKWECECLWPIIYGAAAGGGYGWAATCVPCHGPENVVTPCVSPVPRPFEAEGDPGGKNAPPPQTRL